MKTRLITTFATATAFSMTVSLNAHVHSNNADDYSTPPVTAQPYEQRDRDAEDGKHIIATAIEAGQFNTLIVALQAAGLIDALTDEGPFTVFAPTDEAFDKLPEGALEELLQPENRETLRTILTYHVVSAKAKAEDVVKLDFADTLANQRVSIKVEDDTVKLNGSTKVIKTDVMASNGVIHVIDSIIMPNTKDLLETAAEAGDFSTLAQAIRDAGLVSTLQGNGPFTVFAPTDEAFANVPSETMDMLLQPENREQLIAVLTYHVVPGRVYAEQALEAGNATTVQGTDLRIRDRSGEVRINNAKLIKADLDTTNGVIHVIDTVLIPE